MDGIKDKMSLLFIIVIFITRHTVLDMESKELLTTSIRFWVWSVKGLPYKTLNCWIFIAGACYCIQHPQLITHCVCIWQSIGTCPDAFMRSPKSSVCDESHCSLKFAQYIIQEKSFQSNLNGLTHWYMQSTWVWAWLEWLDHSALLNSFTVMGLGLLIASS